MKRKISPSYKRCLYRESKFFHHVIIQKTVTSFLLSFVTRHLEIPLLVPWDIRKMSCSTSIEKRNRTMALLLTNSMTWTSFLTFPSLKYVIYNGAVVLPLCGLFWCYLLSVIPCEKGALSEYFCQTVWIHYLYSCPVKTVKYIFMISKMSKWARKNLVGAIYLVVSTSQC